jgi:hypothetical protein
MDTTNEDAQKVAFASLLRKEGDAFKAGLTLFPNNTNRALRIATEWPNDAKVIAELDRLDADTDPTKDLPTKVDLAKKVWDRLNKAVEDEDFVKLAKLYAEVNGYIEKPQNSTNVNIQQNRVMTVRDFGSEAHWESKMLDQQRALASGTFVSQSNHE